MTNKQFMRSLRLTNEPRDLSPFEARLRNYQTRDQRQMREATCYVFGIAFVIWAIVCTAYNL